MIPRVSYPTLLSQVTQATAGGFFSGNSTYSWIIDENILRKEVSLESVTWKGWWGQSWEAEQVGDVSSHLWEKDRVQLWHVKTPQGFPSILSFPPFNICVLFVHNILQIFVHNILPIFVHNILLWFATVSNLAATSLIGKPMAMYRNKLRKI